jgi:hypothetical protein
MFLSGNAGFMNVSPGFTNDLSFYYSDPYFPPDVSVTVWSGPNGTGSQLATSLNLINTEDGTMDPVCGGAGYCQYSAQVNLPFAGTAQSVEFSGPDLATDILFADITIGGPSGVPGPTAGAGLPGLVFACGGLFLAWRRRWRIPMFDLTPANVSA